MAHPLFEKTPQLDFHSTSRPRTRSEQTEDSQFQHPSSTLYSAITFRDLQAPPRSSYLRIQNDVDTITLDQILSVNHQLQQAGAYNCYLLGVKKARDTHRRERARVWPSMVFMCYTPSICRQSWLKTRLMRLRACCLVTNGPRSTGRVKQLTE